MKQKVLTATFIGLLAVACQPEKQGALNTATAPETEVALPPAQNPTPDRLIRPGKGIGKIAIDDKGENVMAKLGQPDGGDAAMGKAWSVWYSKPSHNAGDTTRYSTAIYTARQMGVGNEPSLVKQIRITSPFFKTEDNIHVGSTLAEISERFPNINQSNHDAEQSREIMIYDDTESGIAFEINKQNICVAITAHAQGEEVTAIAALPYN